ncbi:MAG: HAD family hydrolase [Burkholderiales bacterium]|nr:HAD family hydrolase [Burkholderiales bacterium]
MIRAVFFDLDDTLVDHHHAAQAALAGVRERFAALHAVGAEALAAEHQHVLEDLHHDVAIGVRTAGEARIERYRRLFAFAGADARHAAAAAELHRRVYQANRRAVDGALDLVVRLRERLRIVVVTNNTVAEQEEKLTSFGFASHVDALVTSEAVGAAKPDPRIFRAALDRVRCEAHEVVMVGDAWHADVLGANAAGIRAIWLNRHGVAHPDPALALELRSFVPTAQVAALVVPDHALLMRRGGAEPGAGRSG